MLSVSFSIEIHIFNTIFQCVHTTLFGQMLMEMIISIYEYINMYLYAI